MKVFNRLRSLPDSKLIKAILVIGLLVIAWAFSRRSDTYTYRTQLIIKPSESPTNLDPDGKSEDNLSEIYPRNLEQTLINKALKQTSLRLTMHDLVSEKSFRKIPAAYSTSEQIKLKHQLTRYLRDDDSRILHIAYPDRLIRDLGYDTTTLSKHLKIEGNEAGDSFYLSFNSENSILSSFIVNDLCREIVRIDREMFRVDNSSSLNQILYQLHVLGEEWTNDFSEERFVMETEGKRYWLHENYPRLTSFIKEKDAFRHPVLKEILLLEEKQEKMLAERLRILAEGQNLVQYLQHLENEFPEESYASIKRTVDLQTERLLKLNQAIDSLDDLLALKHQSVRQKYNTPPLIVVRDKNKTKQVHKYRQLLRDANEICYASNNEASRFHQEISSDTLKRIPDLVSLFWIMLIMVAGLHISGLLLDKIRSLWETKN